MNKHSVGRNYLLNLLSSVFNIILPIITTPYISRTLGVANIGIYSFTYSYITIFLLTGALGTATHGQRTIAIHRNNIVEKSKAFYEIFLLRCLSIGAAMIVFLITIWLYGKYYVFFILQLPYFIGAMLDITWYFQGDDNFGVLVVRNIAFKLLGFFCILIFVRSEADLPKYVAILAISNMVGNISMWPLIKKSAVKISIKQLDIAHHFRATIVFFVPTLAYQLYTIIDKLLLGFLGNEVETGYYEQANKIVTLATTVLSSYNVVIRSKMNFVVNQYKSTGLEKYKEDAEQSLNRSIDLVLMLGCPIVTGITVISSNLTGWFFGPGFDKVGLILKVFGIMVLVNSFRGLLGSAVFNPLGIEMQRKANRAQWTAAIVNLILTACLIPQFYSCGAVMASIVSETVILILYFMYAKEILPFRYIVRKTATFMAAAVIMAISICWIDRFINGIICTLIQIATGAAVYFLILFVFKEEFFNSLIHTAEEAVKKRAGR